MTKHTPGPWKTEGEGIRTLVRGADATIVSCRHRLPGTIHEANANLIAAAPELLEGLKWLLASGVRHKSFCPAAEKRGECDCGLYRNVELPIAKAEGKANV